MDVVSVVIPYLKEPPFLNEAIESIKSQTYTDHEIVIVDGEYSGRAAEVARNYLDIRYVRLQGGGLAAARNQGIQICSGNYVVFLDTDDRLLPLHFESCLETFYSHPKVAFVCGDYRWFGAGPVTHVHNCLPTPTHYATLLRTNFIGPIHAIMFRRDVLATLGGFALEFKRCEDQELYLRVAARHPIHCHHRVIAEYRRHGERITPRWDLMLAYAMKMLHLHINDAAGDVIYQRAWTQGFVDRHQMYGEPLLSAMEHAARSREWMRAMTYLSVLLRWYPQGLCRLLTGKLRRMSRVIR
jgi:glycosyltransferase involved in cell wall biosynthesis